MLVLIASNRTVPASLKKVFLHCGIQHALCQDFSLLEATLQRDKPDIILCYQPSGSELQQVRTCIAAQKPKPSLFVISNQGTALDRVVALQHGVSQYYLEPVSYTRLVFDLGSIHYTAERLAVYSIGAFQIDPTNQSIRCGGNCLALSKKQYSLFNLLLARSNRVVSRVQIWEAVWGLEQYPLANCIDALVSRVRQRLPKQAPCKIEQVYGIGYRLRLL